MKSTQLHAALRHLTSLLGCGAIVAISGWVEPETGTSTTGETRPFGSSLQRGAASPAEILLAASSGPRPPSRLVGEAPRPLTPTRHKRAFGKKPIRLGLTLPPMVCVVETDASFDVLTEPVAAHAVVGFGAARLAPPLRTDPTPGSVVLSSSRNRYRLAPKGSPPA